MHWYDIIGSNGEPSNTVILGRVKRFHIVSSDSRSSLRNSLQVDRPSTGTLNPHPLLHAFPPRLT
jgi:hypothetical protein